MLLCNECYKKTIQYPVPYSPPPTAHIELDQNTHPPVVNISLSIPIDKILSPQQRFIDFGHLDYCSCTQCGDSFHIKDEWPELYQARSNQELSV